MSDRSIDFDDDTVDEDEDGPSELDLDENELEDRAGRIDERIIGDELVLTRVPRNDAREAFEVLRFDRTQQLLRIFPKATQHGMLIPQFDRVTELQIESPGWNATNHSAEHGQYGLLYARGLPKGFSAIYEFGLGINRDYRDLVDGIQEHTECAIVRFVVSGAEGLDTTGAVFRVCLDRFANYRAAVARSRGAGAPPFVE